MKLDAEIGFGRFRKGIWRARLLEELAKLKHIIFISTFTLDMPQQFERQWYLARKVRYVQGGRKWSHLFELVATVDFPDSRFSEKGGY